MGLSPTERLLAAIERAESAGSGWIDVDSLTVGWSEDDREAVTWYAIAPGNTDIPVETRTLVRFEWASFPSSEASFGLFVIGERAYVCLPPNDSEDPWKLVQRVQGADDHAAIAQAIKDLLTAGRPGGSAPMSVQVGDEYTDAVRTGIWACCDLGGEGDVSPRWTWSDLCDVLITPDAARMQAVATRSSFSTLTYEDKMWILDTYLAQASQYDRR